LFWYYIIHKPDFQRGKTAAMKLINIEKGNWYGWQILPGYTGKHCIPYFSPIFVTDFKAHKSGKGLFRIEFLNAAYAEGVQEFSVEIRMLKRAKDYLVGEITEDKGASTARCAIISNIEFEWLRRFCPELLARCPSLTSEGLNSENLTQYLNEALQPQIITPERE